jgi:FimV-like protein
LASGGVHDTAVGFDFAQQASSSTPASQPASAPRVADVTAPTKFDFGPGIEPYTLPTAEPKAVVAARSSIPPDTTLGHDDGLKFDVKLTDSTFLGSSMPDSSSFDLSSIDLDLKAPELEIPASAPAAKVVAPESGFESVQVSTSVNPDFAAMQSETMINPQSLEGHGSDDGAGNEFSIVQAETLINPQSPAAKADEFASDFEISASEEVTTKLDLARAYEEMADFEGARELLHEVLKEGDATQRETAQAILAKIGA